MAALSSERLYFQRLITGSQKLYEFSLLKTKRAINHEISGMVFSMDRPLQLEALLRSYFKLVNNPAPLQILYKAGSDKIRKYYENLSFEFSSKAITFLEEVDFRKQVLDWLKSETSDRVFFLTDDGIFLDHLDLNHCRDFDPTLNIFSLRHGKDLTYSFPVKSNQDLPLFKEVESSGESFITWSWLDKPDSPDWVYPLSVDGCVFSRQEIFVVCEAIDFRNPNTLEANMQVFVDFFAIKRGVSFQNVKLVNVPCNLVQTEFKNRSTGLFSISELIEVWESGKRINTDVFVGLNAYDAMHAKYEFIKP